MAAYEESLEIIRQLHDSDPTIPEWVNDMAVTYARLGEASKNNNDPTTALQHLKKAREILSPIVEKNPDDVRWKNNLDIIENNITRLEKSVKQ